MMLMRPGLDPKMAGMDVHAQGMGFNGYHPGMSDQMPQQSPPYAGPPADMPPPHMDPRVMAAHSFGGGGKVGMPMPPMMHPMQMAPQGPPQGMPMGMPPQQMQPMGMGGIFGSGGHFGGLGATMQMLKARRMAANGFGDKPASQGAFGPGMDGRPGGMNPSLGRSFVSNGFRTEA